MIASLAIILTFCAILFVQKTDLDEKILSKAPTPLLNAYLKIKNENIKQSVKDRLEEELNMRQEKYDLTR